MYNQASGETVCSALVFAANANASATDNSILNERDSTASGLVVANDYNVTKLNTVDAGNDIDGDCNDMSGQAPGFARIDVEPQAEVTAKCSMRWDLPLCVQGVSVISTKAVMVHAYVPDEELVRTGK